MVEIEIIAIGEELGCDLEEACEEWLRRCDAQPEEERNLWGMIKVSGTLMDLKRPSDCVRIKEGEDG